MYITTVVQMIVLDNMSIIGEWFFDDTTQVDDKDLL